MSRISIKKIGGVSFLYIDDDYLLININDIIRIQSSPDIDTNIQSLFIHTGSNFYHLKDFGLREFFDFLGTHKIEEPKEDVLSLEIDEIFPLDGYNDSLTSMCRCSLWRCGIYTVGDLVKKTGKELLDIRRFGPSSLKKTEARLKLYGLSLKDN